MWMCYLLFAVDFDRKRKRKFRVWQYGHKNHDIACFRRRKTDRTHSKTNRIADKTIGYVNVVIRAGNPINSSFSFKIYRFEFGHDNSQ